MQREPVLVTQLVAALMALAIAFGVPISDDQRAAVIEVVSIIVLIYLGGAFVARSKVWSPHSVAELRAAAEQADREAAALREQLAALEGTT